MGEKPPEREGWTKVTDKKEAHRRSIEIGKEHDEKWKRYAEKKMDSLLDLLEDE